MQSKISVERRVFKFLQDFQLIPKEIREADLFILGLAFIVLIFVSQSLSLDLSNVINWELSSEATRKGGITYSTMLLILGAPLAIYVALTQRPWGRLFRYVIPYFFVIVNALIAFGIGFHMLDNPSNAVKLLAIWQIAQVVVFVLFSGKENVGDFYDIPSRQARVDEVLLAAVVVGGVIIFSLLQNWYWAVTFSTILFVWRIADGLLNSGYFGRHYDLVLALGSKKRTITEKDILNLNNLVAALIGVIILIPILEAAFFDLIVGLEVHYVQTMAFLPLFLFALSLFYKLRRRWMYGYAMAFVGIKAMFALLAILQLKQQFGLIDIMKSYPLNITIFLGLITIAVSIWALTIFIRLFEEAK